LPITVFVIARVAGSSGEEIFDVNIPAEKQKVTYQAKDGTIKTVTKAELQEQMEASEKLMQSLHETWEEKMARTQEIHKEREKALEELGITVDKGAVGVHTPKKMPHLVNLVSSVICFQVDQLAETVCHHRTKVIAVRVSQKRE
jgi:kinesin family protein 1